MQRSVPTERCPICHARFPLDALNAHVNACFDGTDIIDVDELFPPPNSPPRASSSKATAVIPPTAHNGSGVGLKRTRGPSPSPSAKGRHRDFGSGTPQHERTGRGGGGDPLLDVVLDVDEGSHDDDFFLTSRASSGVLLRPHQQSRPSGPSGRVLLSAAPVRPRLRGALGSLARTAIAAATVAAPRGEPMCVPDSLGSIGDEEDDMMAWSASAGTQQQCPSCLSMYSPLKMYSFHCRCRASFCRDLCLDRIVQIAISEKSQLSCPMCKDTIHHNEISDLLGEKNWASRVWPRAVLGTGSS